MVSKLVSLLLIFLAWIQGSDNDQFFVVSTTETPAGGSDSDIQDSLRALNRSISHLNMTKDDIIAEIQSILEKRLKSCNPQVEGHPKDCKEVQRRGSVDSGIYRIRPELSPADFWVWCEMSDYGGGWTSVLNRFDGSQNFYLNWTDYKRGFGKLSGEHWLGLEHLYELTNGKSMELLFELVDWDLRKVHAIYDKFKIGSGSEYYKIHSLGNYRGDAGDSFSSHLNQQFSTADVDRDVDPGNCAKYREGGWWYSNCYNVHPTGQYVKNPTSVNYKSAIKWELFHGLNYSLKEVRMMIRPRSG